MYITQTLDTFCVVTQLWLHSQHYTYS